MIVNTQDGGLGQQHTRACLCMIKCVTTSAKINHVGQKNHQFFPFLLFHNFQTICKISITTADFNGLSSEIYGNGIAHSELKIAISKNITQCNLCSHGWFLHAQSHNNVTCTHCVMLIKKHHCYISWFTMWLQHVVSLMVKTNTKTRN